MVVKDNRNRRVMILETKISATRSDMEKDCQEAVDQIVTRQYVRDFLCGYKQVVCYGVSFFKKECMVKRIELE